MTVQQDGPRPLDVATEVRPLRDLREQRLNARYMTVDQFDRLKRNLVHDGVLTSAPLVYQPPGQDYAEIVSGHHRIKAAIAAGIDEAPCLVIRETIPLNRLRALQLSHNAIEGQDDPATLRQLYESLDVEARDYSGLDDASLALLDEVDVSALGEVNLDFLSVMLVFLPPEHERAAEALTAAKKVATSQDRWLAPYPEYDRTLDALGTVHDAHSIGNVSTALSVILDVFERHIGDLRDGYLDPDGLPSRKGWAPLEPVVGARLMPVESLSVIAQALDKMEARGEVTATNRWAGLELLCADYLAGE